MVIEIRGVGIENKGAYLMLKAILLEIKRRRPNAIVIAEATKAFPMTALEKEGVKKRLKTFKKGIEFGSVIGFLPESLRRRFGWYLVKDVDYVFDASGFFIGDQWSASSIEHRLGRDTTTLKDNAKIVLLPQAFGPFTKESVRKAAEKVFLRSHAIFARDEVSFNDVQKNFEVDGKLYLAPDFTNLLEVPSFGENLSETITIVPNQKLIEQNAATDVDSYLVFLKNVVESIRRHRYTAMFLIHSGNKDLHIAEQVNALLSDPVRIMHEHDPLIIKSIIGGSKGLVTGRFHGLVSALCQGVPVLATSWSHKYEMLLHDYDFAEGLLSVTTDIDAIEDRMNIIYDKCRHELVSQKLKLAAEVQKERAKNMWNIVFEQMVK